MTLVTYFQDCIDNNAINRLKRKIHAYTGGTTDVIPIEHMAAVGMDLVDMLQASRIVSNLKPLGRQIILANMARRELSHGVYRNGPPFCYFKVGEGKSEVLVVSTFTEDFLTLAHRLGIVEEVNLLEIHDVLESAIKNGHMRADEAEEIEFSQFRSLDFVPLAARLLTHSPFWLVSEVRHLGDPPPPKGIALRFDNFGNIFTDVLPEDVGFEPGGKLTLVTGEEINCYKYLADVPPGELAAVIGSSGYAQKRFIMVTIQGTSAEAYLDIHTPGDAIIDVSAL